MKEMERGMSQSSVTRLSFQLSFSGVLAISRRNKSPGNNTEWLLVPLEENLKAGEFSTSGNACFAAYLGEHIECPQ
jgi:hypothetical protein